MNEFLLTTLTFAAGLVLGGVFFGGLWWTVRKGVSSAQPALWFFGSLALRMCLALAGFYFVGRGSWKRMVSCLIGFMVARFIVMYLNRTPIKHSGSPAKEGSHAP